MSCSVVQHLCRIVLCLTACLGGSGCASTPSASGPPPRVESTTAPATADQGAAQAPTAPVPSTEPEASAVPTKETLQLASTPWAPFTDVPGKPRVALDLVHGALSRAGYAATTSIIEIQPLIRGLKEDKFDGSAALWLSPEREAFLLFSVPYLENRLVLVARAGSDVSAKSLGALKGKTVGIVAGYAYGEGLQAAPATRFVEGPSEEQNLHDLLAGKLDYVLVDDLFVHQLFQQYPEQASQKLVVGRETLIKRSLHFAVRKSHPHAADIIARFNQAIHSLLADGSYNQVLGVAWVRADIDGDGRAELIASNTQAGVLAPQGGYTVLSLDAPPPEHQEGQQRYYIGGKYYEDWDVVPDTYKTDPADDKFLHQYTIKVFEF